MFKKFMDFVGEEKRHDFESSEEFLKIMGGSSFLNGMYRIFDEKNIPKWNDIVEIVMIILNYLSGNEEAIEWIRSY